MMTATSPSRISHSAVPAALIGGLVAGGIGLALAQPMPDGEKGRYSLSPVADGVIRLDTRTGAVSSCNNTGTGWACYAVPDERAALDAEIGRLQVDNDKLRAELAARGPIVTDKTDEALPKPKVTEGERKIEIPLPSDRDIDRVFSFLERAWQRLVEMANRMQKDVTGKI